MDTLIAGAKRLVDAGCTALAIVCRFPDDETDEDKTRTRSYVEGSGVDPVGGAEAMISRVISHCFSIPCAHAPANRVDASPGVSRSSCTFLRE